MDGIKYQRLGDEHYYAQELFEQEELIGYLKNMRAETKSRRRSGTYNPDCAVLIEKDGAERLYFVVETKSSLFTDDLRDKEVPRLSVAKLTSTHWRSAKTLQKFIQVRNIDNLLAKVLAV